MDTVHFFGQLIVNLFFQNLKSFSGGILLRHLFALAGSFCSYFAHIQLDIEGLVVILSDFLKHSVLGSYLVIFLNKLLNPDNYLAAFLLYCRI